MKKPFFHRISTKRFEEMKESGAIWGDVLEQYRQPAWCGYPDALRGQYGCWSLTLRKVKKQSDCGNCELIKHPKTGARAGL